MASTKYERGMRKCSDWSSESMPVNCILDFSEGAGGVLIIDTYLFGCRSV